MDNEYLVNNKTKNIWLINYLDFLIFRTFIILGNQRLEPTTAKQITKNIKF